MKNWMAKPAWGLLALATAILPAPGVVAGADREPPSVMVHAPGTVEAGASMIVEAQIIDPSGIGRVALWVRGEHEAEFKQISMEKVGPDQVRAEIPPWPERGSEVAYYIEARDGEGNGPAFAGAPRAPYVIYVKGVTSAPAPVKAKTNWVLWGVTAVSLIALVVGYLLYRRMARERLHAELNAELNRLTGILHEPQPKKKAAVEKPVKAKRRSRVPQDPAEQAFWIGLLSPLVDMGILDKEHALKGMSVRAHYHPTLGKRFFDVGTLTRHLEWVERGDVRVTPEMLAGTTSTGPSKKT